MSSDIVYGLRAGLAVFEARRGDIERVAFSREVSGEADALVKWANARGLPCKETREDELARIARSPHHEGLCVGTKPRRFLAAPDLSELLVRRKGFAIALDRVRNPYNVGAIVRTAAFFGVDAMILGAPAPHPALAPDAVRVAEGGAEHVALARTTDLAETLARLKSRGVAIVGADGQAKNDAATFRFARPLVLVVGHEREGLGARVREQCDALVAIGGEGTIESLNVAVATGVLVASVLRSS
ncbi:MAG TPA: RNA methyltransferase [Polyangiaceae bacterium]